MTIFCFPGSHLVKSISPLPYMPGERTRDASRVIATLFNSGQHLYWDLSPPRWYGEFDQPLVFLSYRDFSGCGRMLAGAQIQHLGHLYGVRGGPAQVAVEHGFTRWRLTCKPCILYYIIDFSGIQGVFQSRRSAVLSRRLLSHG